MLLMMKLKRGAGADGGAGAAGNINDVAARATMRIKQKLKGFEDGTAGECMSVEGQVQLLVDIAKDPHNLCKLYFGWAPWL
jgi:ataxia telangiectasia mutated family protein